MSGPTGSEAEPPEEPVEGVPESCGDGEPDPTRRRFLHGLALSLGGAAGAAISLPWLGVVLSPALREDPQLWRPVGRIGDFSIGETVKVTYLDPDPLPWAGFLARSAAWLRRESDVTFAAFTSYCTHVGCPVRWEPGARLFMCPCHGGAFYADGSVAAGPPPRPLDRYPVRVRDGVVEIQAMGVQAE